MCFARNVIVVPYHQWHSTMFGPRPSSMEEGVCILDVGDWWHTRRAIHDMSAHSNQLPMLQHRIYSPDSSNVHMHGMVGSNQSLPSSDDRAFVKTTCCVAHIRGRHHSSISRHNGAGGNAPTLQPGGSRIESVWTMHFSEWFFDAASPWWHWVSASLLHVARHSRHDYGPSWCCLFILPMVST